ncbi:MAG: peptidoglycan editing factor PgeF [Alphaproteobacteria bacterium]|nr:peptidoglycan editing factor PgeF [Alphaproteobacteria bacterium]
MKQVSNLTSLDFIDHAFYDATDFQNDPDPIFMNQVHSADALFLTEKPLTPPSVDALITKTPGLNLTVKTADCAPVLLADPTSKMIAAVHAGWKGAFQGILEATVLEMVNCGANIKTIQAGIGPHIQLPSFEIGPDTKALFPKTEEQFFISQADKLFFDFDAYVIHRLKRAGIRSIESVGDDTYPDPLYFSYRRNPSDKGRQFSSISIKGG